MYMYIKLRYNEKRYFLSVVAYLTLRQLYDFIKVVHNRYAKIFLKFNFSETLIFCSMKWILLNIKFKKKFLSRFPPQGFEPTISDRCQMGVNWNIHYHKMFLLELYTFFAAIYKKTL